MEQTSHEEHAALGEIVKRVDEIKAKIMAAATGGKIDSAGSFPEGKLEEVQGYIQELQDELQKILKIHEAVAQRWAAQKIDGGIQEGLARAAVEVVLGEYRQRWAM